MSKLIALSLIAGVMMFASSSANAAQVGLVNANLNMGTIHGNNVAVSANSGGNSQVGTNTTMAIAGGGLGLVVNAPATAASNQQQLMITGNVGAQATQFNQVNGGCSCVTGSQLGLLNLNLNAGSSHNNNVAVSANSGMNSQVGTNTTVATTMPSAGLFVNTAAVASGVQGQQMQTGTVSAVGAQWNYVN
jgi:hypothetical protein